MKVYLVRHGMPEGAEKGRRYLGLTDEPLCSEGQSQADNAGQLIAGMVLPGKVKVAASTLQRSIQTAMIISEHLGCDLLLIDDGLRELNMGIWDGRYLDEIKEAYPEEFEARGKDLWNYRIRDGETFREAGERFREALTDILSDQADDETVVIVAHGGVIRAGLSLMTDKPFDEWMKTDIPYTCVIVLNRTDSGNEGIRFEVERII